MDLYPFAGLAACNPGRTARFRRAGLLIALTWTPSREWEAKVWGPNRVSVNQLEGIAKALELHFYTIESYLSADFTTYVYVITGGRHISPELQHDYDAIISQRRAAFTPDSRF